MNANRVMGIVYCREVLNTPRWWDNPVITVQEGDSMISRLRVVAYAIVELAHSCGTPLQVWVAYSCNTLPLVGLFLGSASLYPVCFREQTGMC
jgi:hypothetical protein